MQSIVAVGMDFDNLDFEQDMVEKAGFSFSSNPSREPDVIIEALKDADGALTSYGSFTKEVFEALPKLKVVSRTGTGVDNIDIPAATKNNTALCNVPVYGTEVVSDHAIALTLAVLRRINELDADLRSGVWDFQRRKPLGQIQGRTFGVVGMGHIGRATAYKARGLGFNVVVWDRSLVPGRLTPENFPIVTLDELYRVSDVVSFHVALVPETEHMLNREKLEIMKDTAIVINTSRGAVIDTKAVAEALEDDKLFGAGLDVFEEEPIDPHDPIFYAPHTVLTAHAAYWSEESAKVLRTRCTQGAIDVLEGKVPESCLNPEVLPAAFAK
ncbi:MAG: C-terminal binding protein [Eggerthellaceae bacterium]|nr:C-terminal binding protein [Eggerthellaceae bacterium]